MAKLTAESLQSTNTTLDKQITELQKKKQVEEYKASVSNLADKIVLYSQSQSPVSGQMVEILLPFLEMAMVMESTIEMMAELDGVINLIGSAMNILDQTMESSQNIIASTVGIKYTWWRRLKRKIMMAQAKANNRARAKAIAEQVADFYEMAIQLKDVFSTIPQSMHATMERINNRNKRGKKGADTSIGYQMSPAIRDMLASRGANLERLGAEGGIDIPASSTPSGDEGAGGASGASGISSSGL